jgi:predicted MFS family arabinose efflux permease
VSTRWFLLAILTGSYGAGAFGVLGISPLSPSLVAGFGLTRLQVALIVPSIYLGGLLFSLPGGRLADRLGARPSLLGGLGIKQMGLTLGGIASALVLPRVAAAFGWRAAIATCGLVVALPVVLSWRPLGRLDDAPTRQSSVARDDYGAGAWAWARRPAILAFFASGLVLGMVQAAVLSYLPLYTIQALGFDPIGAGLLVACSQAGGSPTAARCGSRSRARSAPARFALYAVWLVSTPLAAGALAFATGIGAYGWVGIFFVISAELGGSRMAGLLSGMAFASIVIGLLVGPATFGLLLVRWDSYTAPWTAFAVLSAVAACATLVISSAIERERR